MIIHVDGGEISRNKFEDGNRPVIICKDDKERLLYRTNKLEIMDSQGNTVATLVYDRENPLQCGASAWIKADNIKIVR